MEEFILTKEDAENALKATKLEIRFKKRSNYLVATIIDEIKELFKNESPMAQCRVVMNAPEGSKIIFHILIGDVILPPQECDEDILYNQSHWLIELTNIKDAITDARKLLRQNKKPTLFQRLVDFIS